jgi:6-pyruvoyl-tetrahydropterin synthase
MSPLTSYRILLAHPSEEVRAVVRRALNAQPHLQVVGEVAVEADLLPASLELKPDLILLAEPFKNKKLNFTFQAAGKPLARQIKTQLPEVKLIAIAGDAASRARVLGEGALAAMLSSDVALQLVPALQTALGLNGFHNGNGVAAEADHQAETLLAPHSLAASNRRAVYTLGMETFFNARHFVETNGRAGPIHAHSFRVTVKIRQTIQPGKAYGLGFGEVRAMVQSETNQFNDKLLNQMPPFSTETDLQPTTENLAAVLYQRIRHKLPVNMRLDSITVWESPTNYVTYAEEEG